MTKNNNPRCHGCGQPPYNNNNGIIIPLKRCSRCKQVWYHNAECQRNDWKRHRQQDNCIILQNDTNKNLMVLSHSEQSYHILKQDKKGNSVMASKRLTMGDVVLVDTNPIVPPVLREDYRLLRCAVCFAKLNSVVVVHDSVETTRYSYGSRVYPIRLCSQQCQTVSNGWIQQESQVVEKTLMQHSFSTLPKILPTAILLYRIVRYLILTTPDDDPKRQQILNLYPPDRSVLRYTKQNTTTITNTRNDKEEEEIHKIAVLFTVHNLLLSDPKTQQQYSSSKSNNTTTTIDLELLLLKLKTNSFTITDGESTPIGIGLYSQASNINHSCVPNILPTFQYGIPGTTPHVRFTVCCHPPILPGKELCIPYMDVTAPQSLRKRWLQKSYYFDCDCERCSTTNTDFTTTEEEENLDINKTLSLYKHEQHFLSMETKYPTSSWYYQESGERYLQALLDSIDGSNSTNQHPMTICQQALEVVSKLILPYPNKKYHEGWRILRTCLLTYKCAKLRLYLQYDDDPILAIQELQQCLETYQLFYDKNHEFVQELQETIQQAYGI